MNKTSAIEIITDFHKGSLPSLIERAVNAPVPTSNKTLAIIGPRRAGKTFFLYDIMIRLKGVEKTKMLFVNLEDDRFFPPTLQDLDLLLKTYYELYPENKKERVFFFFDEIQNIPRWESFVRRIMDTENVQVFISGSSSKLLATEEGYLSNAPFLPRSARSSLIF